MTVTLRTWCWPQAGDNPGPLISNLITPRYGSRLPVPLTIIPGHLTREELEKLA
jgi:hypothetical protein